MPQSDCFSGKINRKNVYEAVQQAFCHTASQFQRTCPRGRKLIIVIVIIIYKLTDLYFCRSSTFSDVQLESMQSTSRRIRTVQAACDSPSQRDGSSAVAAVMSRSVCGEARPPSRLPVATFHETRCSMNGNAAPGKCPSIPAANYCTNLLVLHSSLNVS